MTSPTSNLYENLPGRLPDELFTTLLDAPDSPGLRVERIVSEGHATAPGVWLQQERAEWVLLLRGAAGLGFEGDSSIVELKAGDFINIPARRRHRVLWTSPDEQTLWLAIHYDEPA